MGEILAGGVFMGSHPKRSGAAGEIPTGVEELWEQEEGDRGCSEEASIASTQGVVGPGVVCGRGSGVTLLSAL